MVLWIALRKSGRIYQKLSHHVCQKCTDSDASSSGRSRHHGPDWLKPAVLPRAETLRSGCATGALSARRPWPQGGETLAGPAQPRYQLVRFTHEMKQRAENHIQSHSIRSHGADLSQL